MPDLDPEVEQTWVRPRGRDRYPAGAVHDLPSSSPFAATPIQPAVSGLAASVPPAAETADSTDSAVYVEPLVPPRAASSAVSQPTAMASSLPTEPRRGRRASPIVDPAAEAAEREAAASAQAVSDAARAEQEREARLAADRATVAAQGEALRRVAQRHREQEAVRPAPSVEGAEQQVLPERRLVAGGVFDGPLPEVPSADGPIDVATRAISVVRQAVVTPPPIDAAHPDAKRTLIMGVLNVTLDSFSDGGRYARFDDAVEHARRMASDGADLIDVGGESTRPGAPRVEVHEEQRRVIPVIRELVALGLRVSVDTMNAATAFAAVEAGAEVVNDVSGGLADPNMAQVVADTDATYIAMHWRGHSATMQQHAQYSSAVAEVKAELFQRVAELVVQGVDPARIVIDPGLGFAKLAQHNWQLLGHLHELDELGLPVLVAASRKRFLGGLLPEDAGVRERDPATAVISALAAQAGAWGVRVHDVASTRAALDVWEAWQKGSCD
ncbi:dihydropteroate synthase [Frondihabitans australicus]|uniref:Dihydropteroate synthase n=1 Tax=Frondihabitans australicus TaxID=386892 RepID=A0A495IKQ8_9MICO|nr:dihydropteroate synthase [Frondihabitans australicus]